MGNAYKSTGDRLKGDPYIEVCDQALATAERLCLTEWIYCHIVNQTSDLLID